MATPRVKRPTKYSPAIASRICSRIASGDSAQTITSSKEYPTYSRLSRWLREHPDFQKMYALAREDQADLYAEDILRVSEQAINGEVDPQAARLKVDSLKWIASKLRPRVYGDRQVIEHEVGDKLSEALRKAEERVRSLPKGDPPVDAIDV